MSRGLPAIPIHLFLSLLLAVTLLTKQSWSETPGLDLIDKPIQKHKSNLERLQQGMKIHLGKLLVIGEKEYKLLDQIEQLDRNLSLQRIRLEVMVERLNNQEELFVLKKRDLKIAEQNKKRVRNHLETRLRSFYLMGKTGILNVTFSSRTLPDFMLFNDSFMTLLEYDKTLFDNYRESIEQLTQARDEHEKESILLNEFIANAVEQQQELDSLLEDKRVLLKKIKTQKILHEQAIKELKKAEEDLRITLVKLKRKRDYTIKGFVLNKGNMPAPVKGKLLRRFGEIYEGEGIETGRSQGITIDAPNGAAIKTIFAGQVIFAGYRKGFGNMVIIDHGLNYYSITSRMEKIIVTEGQIVSDGNIIGTAGDIATLFNKGVYFEIRHDTEPIDPLDWISIKGQ